MFATIKHAALQERCRYLHNSTIAVFSSAFRVVTSMGLTTRTGRPIPKQTFSRMVRNEFYAGWIVSGDVRVKGTHAPFISEKLYTAVQAKLDGGQPNQKEHEDFPLLP